MYTKHGELKINWRCQNRKCKTYMTTIGTKQMAGCLIFKMVLPVFLKYTQFFLYKKPRVRGSGSAFLRIPEFESQKFLRSIKISVFSFLTFSYFEPLIFLKFYTKNTSRTIILDFWSKELSFCIKC